MSARTVVFFTDSWGMGGAEEALTTLVGSLDAERWHVVVMHHGGDGIGPLLERMRRLGVRDVAVPRVRRLGNVRALARLVAALRAERPAVFHANLNAPRSCQQALLGAVLAGAPAIVATQHFFGAEASESAPWRHRVAVRGVDRYVAVSHDTAERLRPWLGGDPARIVVIHNGIAVERFGCGQSSGEVRTPSNGRLALAIGRLVERKGYHLLLEAASRIADVRLALAGDGPERGALEAQARTLGVSDRVEFLGHREDVPALLATCDVFVLPSLFEGHPLSVLEAMAAARPVVATDSGGTREAVLHGETGFLVAPGDVGALEQSMRAILDAPALARQMGAAGSARVHREFSAARMAQRYGALYDELLEKSA